MPLEDITLWLVMAMSLTAVAFLVWTLVAVVRRSRSSSFLLKAKSHGNFSGLASGDPDSV